MAKEEIKYFKIKNWDKYQHRDATRNGNMPWIKLYISMFRDEKIESMTPTQGWIWVNCLLLAGETCNKIPVDPPTLRRRCAGKRIHDRLDIGFLWSLDLIEPWAAGLDLDTDKTKTKTASRQLTSAKPPKENKTSSIITEKVLQIWNERTGLKTKGLFPRRLDLILKHFEEKPDFPYWIDVFGRVKNSEFLMGTQKKWKMTLEWAMSHHIEISEGKYDSEKSTESNLKHLPSLR